MSLRLSILFGLELAVLAASAAAESGPAHHYVVTWSTGEGAESCRQQNELSGAVARLVSAELLSSPELADRVIVGRASRADSWLAVLSVRDAQGNVLGERELKSDATSCRELDDSVALAIALIIDPERGLAQVNAGSTPTSNATPEPPPAAPPAVIATPAPARATGAPALALASARKRRVQGGAVAVAGLLPDIALGAQLEVWLPLGSPGLLRISAAYLSAQTRGVDVRPGVDTSLYAGTLRAAYCPVLAGGQRYMVFGCAGLESGVMVARGHGAGYDAAPARPLLGLDAALTVDRALTGPWALSATAGASLTPLRPTFSYQTVSGSIPVYRRSAVEGRFEIGLAYRF
jgi:hypothetical protein